MKPLIFYCDWQSSWVCMFYPDSPPATGVGYGETPKEAFDDWQQQMKRYEEGR